METILLKNESWLAEISPERGGNIVRLEYNGRPVLRTPSQASDPYLFGMPILLPANRTFQGIFHFDGAEYRLPVNECATPANLHGSVHAQRFSLRNADSVSARLEFTNHGEVYPFAFLLRVSYALCAQGLICDYAVENIGNAAMPLTFGLHSCFVAPAFFRVPLALEQERDARNLPTGRYIPLDADQREYARGTDPRGRRISGYFSSAGPEARIGELIYRASEGFDHWVLYNAGGCEGLLCVEPQCGAVNGLNLPGGCRRVEPGNALTLRTTLFHE